MSIALCPMCHGPDLTGGAPIEEGAPPGPSLLPYGVSGGWSEEEFIRTIRTGLTPSGRALDGDVMPWEFYGGMTDEELIAIRQYVVSLAEEGMPGTERGDGV